MKLCVWGVTENGEYCEESYFSVHTNDCRDRQITKWFERVQKIKKTYSLITYLAVPTEFLPAGTEGDLLQAVLIGDSGVMLNEEAGKFTVKEYERA